MPDHTQKKDTLFQTGTIKEDFVFNERVAEVFDDMLDRSIPLYQEVIRSMARLLDTFLMKDDRVIDLGCATGTSLLQFSRQLEGKGLHFTGVDNSTAMLGKARLKTELFSKNKQLNFIEGDITKIDIPDTSAFLLNYTLQFIRPLQRQPFIKRLYKNLRPGGILLLSEKVINHDSVFNRKYIDIYHSFKKESGYSELEIAQKREALENVLIPFSIDENLALLNNAGFSSTGTFFQWFNFASFIAIK